MKRWKLRQEDCCPRCHQPTETKAHLTQCQAMEAIQTWTMVIKQLEQWLRSTHMAPEIRKEIIKGLQSWQKGESMQMTPTTSDAADEQNKLRWDLALEGCLLRRWQSQQEAFWKAFQMRMSSRRWMLELIKKLLGVAWDMWQQ